ncbi:DNA polymerase IV [Lachnospiraceae bacterium MD1]|jgi:DNA polymerase-4|uniref:DNA polymerase IV n=1 Tax=Variimorphobacter saccharofermentans TaxID=2755051 RepID=A0A839JVX1_9FIRM|nr:DNA polymerase IV [Variimorphobacter saccharofermentans]MBB2181417.1 DNA polymerase IV [Variimorphobacter saccharofermentans]
MDNIIFHIDVNSAFLSWEAVYRLHVLGEEKDLREIPSAVGGDIKKRHGIILARSTPAKKFGVRTGDTISDAKKLCPDLVLVPPHYDLYDTCSKAFMEILREFSPVVEQYSVDEAYCDMTGTIGLYGSAVVAANLMKDRIANELGFTVNIGISSNKLLAKMASDFKKPNLVHTLFPHEMEKKMWKLPVEELFYVGHATKRKLHMLGIHTIGELARTDLDLLRAHFKKYGEVIYAFANGIDMSMVSNEVPANKGYGNSLTIAFDVDRSDVAKMVLLSLSETVATRLRADSVMATVIAVSMVTSEFHHTSHQLTLLSPTNTTNEIHRAACQLFDELWDGSPLRNLGVHTSRVVHGDFVKQINLFDMNRYERLSKLDKVVDQVRERYGSDSIMRAIFLNNPVYHMAGGIAPEKRKPNYGTNIKE